MTKIDAAGLLDVVVEVCGLLYSPRVVKFVGCKLHVNSGAQVVRESNHLKSFHEIINER